MAYGRDRLSLLVGILQISKENGLPWWVRGKRIGLQYRTSRRRSLIPGQEDPWRRTWQPTPVFLPEESHAQRSLVGSMRLQIVGHDGVATLSLDHHPETTLRQ